MDLACLSPRKAMLQRIGEQFGEDQPARNSDIRAEADVVGLEVCGLLAPVCVWFTEGFNAPGLQEAQALLDEWS
jgi:hypothetical protein